MWLFTPSGFFSAVEDYGDAGRVLVRARFPGDLERLCRKHGLDTRVEHTPRADYPWRMRLGKDAWADVARDEARDIGYTNSKSRAHDGTPRDFAYLEVWAALKAAGARAADAGGART